jgi:hypothetical protein
MKNQLVLFIVVAFAFGISIKGLSQHRNDYNDVTTEQPGVGIVGGLSGFKNNFIEIGIGYQPWEVKGHYVFYPFAGFLAMYEFDPTRKLYGTSLNAWYLAGFFSCGLGVNRYSDYKHETYGVKPMIGISCFRVGIMYGYNFFLNKNSITNLAHNTFTIKYNLPIWKKK